MYRQRYIVVPLSFDKCTDASRFGSKRLLNALNVNLSPPVLGVLIYGVGSKVPIYCFTVPLHHLVLGGNVFVASDPSHKVIN